MICYFRLIAGLLFLFSLNTFAIDSDSDGIPDENDNCPNVANLECSMVNGQYTCIMPDADGDGIGDACEDFDVDLNTFENGQVADANQVNENFEKLKAAFEEVKILVDRNACLAVEGNYINGLCFNPELEIENISIPAGSLDFEVTNFNTSDFQYQTSNFLQFYIEGTLIGTGDDVYSGGGSLICNLQDKNGTIFNLLNKTSWNDEWFSGITEIPIEHRDLYRLFCSSTATNPIEIREVAIDFTGSSKDLNGDGIPDNIEY